MVKGDPFQSLIFQFPVGMSNRSYIPVMGAKIVESESYFNSPWECRIGPTLTIDVAVYLLYRISIPRGNVE